MSTTKVKFITDTSTLCIFDLLCLKHRLDDDADWWSIEDEEVNEINQGNVAFLGLGGDGEFTVQILENIPDPMIETNLKVVSGKVFIGAGEEVTSDELEPECVRGGAFISLPPGNYILSAKIDVSDVCISFTSGGSGENDHKVGLRFFK